MARTEKDSIFICLTYVGEIQQELDESSRETSFVLQEGGTLL